MLKIGIFILFLGLANVYILQLCDNINVKFIFTKDKVVFIGRGHLHFLQYPLDIKDAHFFLQT